MAGGIVFIYVPVVLLVTQTSILQSSPALMVPPVQETVVPPVGALRVPPMQLAFLVAGVETPAAFTLLIVTPAGRSSVIEKFVRFVSLGAKRSILNLELLPAWIVEEENDLVPTISVPVILTVVFAGN